MRIALCDDNNDWIKTEEQYLERIQDVEICYDVFSSGEELLMAYKTKGRIYEAIFWIWK